MVSSIPNIKDVRVEAISLLIQGLGIAKTAMFIRETYSSNTDYLKIKEEIFGSKTVNDLYQDIKNWREKRTGTISTLKTSPN